MMIPGMDMPNVKRNEYGLWLTPEENWKFSHACTECGYSTYSKPTTFCGGCGAIMMNVNAAVAEFENYLADVGKRVDERLEQMDEQTNNEKEGDENA